MWVIVEMVWAYDDVDQIKVSGPFASKDDARLVMEYLMDDRPGGTSYMIRPVESPK